MSNRFLSKNHIRRASEFDAVFNRGKRLPLFCFSLSFVSTSLGYPRLGLVVGKKHCPRAVDRNRIKRLVREQFRLRQHALGSIDVVVLLRSSTQAVTDQERCEWLEKLFSQLITACVGPA